jgi:hypothetical protein
LPAGWIVELLFGVLGLIPDEREAKVVEASVSWNYTTFLNIVFLALSAILVARFLRTGAPAMLRMMNMAPEHGEEHVHAGRSPLDPGIRRRNPRGCDVHVSDAPGGPVIDAGPLSEVRHAVGSNDSE